MHSEQAYLRRLTSTELKGALWGASHGTISLMVHSLDLILNTLHERRELEMKDILHALKAAKLQEKEALLEAYMQ